MKTMPSASSRETEAKKAPTPRAAKPKPAPSERAAQPDGEADHEATIRLAAYAFYESRGRTDGHALDDWLAAKAQVEQSGAAHPGAGMPAR